MHPTFIAAAAAGLILSAASASATTVRIHYDSGKQTVSVHTGQGVAAAKRGEGNIWSYSWPDSAGDISMKPALGPTRLSTGGRYTIKAGATLDIYPFFGAARGSVTILPPMASPQLKNSRALRVYLPPSYAENPAKRYPVLYMHDGQNLFDAATAAYGAEWGIDETADRLIGAGVMDEIIVVGIDNTPARMAEYAPCCDSEYGGGKLDAYRAFITDTVKPAIDAAYRTLPAKDHTAIMGSSLGGIASMLIAHKRPDVFSKAGVVSPSFWWNEEAMLKSPPARAPVAFYLDAGANKDGLEQATQMRDILRKQGYQDGRSLLFYADPAGSHNEKSWAARVHRPLAWFFPWGSTQQ